MIEPLVSVIIPFYNEALFLERAVNSVIGQGYKNLELILVDDGSTDSSNEIALNICKKHSQCKLFRIKNSGPGNARNIGLQNVKGKYVVFLDADDELFPEMIETMFYNLLETKSDVAICKFDLVDFKGSCIFTQGFKNISSTVISKNEACVGMYNHNIASTVWAKIYKTKIAKSIKFQEELWFEDRPYLLSCFLKSNRISFVEKSLLKIHSRSNSITRRTIESKRIIDIYKIYKIEIETVYKNELESKKQLIQTITGSYIRSLIDTFMIIEMDKEKCLDFEQIKILFLKYLNDFTVYYKQQKIHINFKDKLLILTLKLIKIIGWKTTCFIILLFYKRKYLIIKQIKGS